MIYYALKIDMTTPFEENVRLREELNTWDMIYNGATKAYMNVENQCIGKYKKFYDGEYQEVFGKIPSNSEAFRMYGYRKPFGYLADIPDIDKNFVNAMNDNLPKDNALRQIIDTDKDGKLSVNEVEGFFNNFTNDTNKLSGSQLDNLFALKNNAINVDTLFDADGRRGESLHYDDVVGKSIIIGEDFHKLDIADGKEDGIIQKDTFEKFDFDTNKDGIIDRDEYQAGMQRIEASLQNNMECDNGKSGNNLSSMQKDKPIISE